jgi:NTE family protein
VLHEAGIEPNWVIGTSIGAINGAIIAGNEPAQRLPHLSHFWDRTERKPIWSQGPLALIGGNVADQMMTIFGGIAGYFTPNRVLGSKLINFCALRIRS